MTPARRAMSPRRRTTSGRHSAHSLTLCRVHPATAGLGQISLSVRIAMRMTRHRLLVVCCSAAVACGDPTATTPTATSAARPIRASMDAGGTELSVTGSGHVIRDLGAGPELSTFSYNAIRRVDGNTTGQFQFNFRLINDVVHGTVTCVTSAGNGAGSGGETG